MQESDDINMDAVKEKLNQIKGFAGKFSKKTKILVGGGAICLIAAAVIIALVMNHVNYAVLFSGVSQEEATKIIGKLQESGANFQYKENGDILVSDKVVEQTRAELAYEGYPKSGFSYDVFINNAGGMTTDTEKQQYKLYELQDRIGATVALFDGVKDAKVNIALQDESKYALEETDDESASSSATVVVTMKNDGDSPSKKQAAAIQRLVSKSVQGMELEDVAVFDGNGLDVSDTSDGGSTASGSAAEEIAQMIEAQISKKVVNVLAPFYGADNIRVSAKGTVNMEKVLRESTTYSTPEKIDEKDKEGIVSNESSTNEKSTGGAATGGVAGSETNADTNQYNAGTAEDGSTYTSESETRDYLVNQIKEQGQIDPGVLKDVTVSVSVNGQDLGSLNQNEIQSLIGNAAGIAAEDQKEKITVVSAPFYEEEEIKNGVTQEVSAKLKEMLPMIAIAAGAALVLLIILIVVLKRRGNKKLQSEEAYLTEELVGALQRESKQPATTENPEMLNLKNERSRELRERVRTFSDQNPEISAQMLKTWLNGGVTDAADGSEQ